MAVLPSSATNIRFLSGVPFFKDYTHTRYFDSRSEQFTYFTNRTVVHTMDQATFQQDNPSVISVKKNIDELRTVNYVMFQNAATSNRWFYGFVDNLEMRTKGVTHVHVVLDVFQTWFLDVSIKPSFVIREHTKLWESDGSPVVNTINEDLDYGSEYDIVDVQQYRRGVKFLVIVSKEALETPGEDDDYEDESGIETGAFLGMPTPLNYYFIPFIDFETPLYVHYSTGGGETIPSLPLNAMLGLGKLESAVNSVVSMYITEDIGIPYTLNTNNTLITFATGSNIDLTGATAGSVSEGSLITMVKVKKVGAFLPTIVKVQDSKYSGFRPTTESKLLMYPYCVFVLDDFKGNRQEFKLEYIDSSTSDTGISLIMKGSIGDSNYVSYGVDDYHPVSVSATLQNQVNNETALLNNNPTDVPILNDNLAAFMQGNRNVIQNQKAQTVFNGTLGAMRGATNGAMMASRGMGRVDTAAFDVADSLGNMAFQMAGIEAKQQDIDNVPAQIGKQGSNNYYSYGNGYDGVFLIKKQIKGEYQRKLENYFKAFGYKVNEIKTPNLHTRQSWNYVQTKGCHIHGGLNNQDMSELKQVFDRGITLWHTNDVGNYLLENEVI